MASQNAPIKVLLVDGARAETDRLLLDLSLPHGDVDALGAHVAQCDIVVLSMNAPEPMLRQALDGGARGYVAAESAVHELLRALLAVAGGERYIDRALEGSGPGGDGKANGLDELTPTEREILRLVVDGKRNTEAALALGLSPRTVETYRGRIMRKLHVDHLPGLVKLAIRLRVTSLD